MRKINNELDERMISERGKGLLIGFGLMVVLLIVKDMLYDWNIIHASTTYYDITIIFLGIFTVAFYMVNKQAVSESYIKNILGMLIFLNILHIFLLISGLSNIDEKFILTIIRAIAIAIFTYKVFKIKIVLQKEERM